MKLLLFLFLCFNFSIAQVKLLSWNIENLGKSKSTETINYIASIINNYDVVAIQEVVAGFGGTQSVAALVDQLNRMGHKWDYVVSNPTISSAYKTERYAYLWKTSVIKKKGIAWLEKKYSIEIDRESYYCTFSHNGKAFTLVNFHAITKSKQPETEIKYFKYLPMQYPELNLIFLGDFNCPQSHTVFNPLRKMKYKPSFVGQKTSLKRVCKNNNCLASEFDNIWFNTNSIQFFSSNVIHFYKDFENLDSAREVSDHIPISLIFKVIN